jgi:ribosomal protein S18 acetylase RimI-like enzyme
MAEFSIAEFCIEDFDAAIALWKSTEGIGLSSADTRERIAFYLERNPGLSFVARANGEMIGAVLCGHDGRRGYLHHLAVLNGWRGRGVGRALTNAALAGLQALGIDKCHLFVYADNQVGREFWVHEGWKERLNLMLVSKDI